MIPVRRLEEPEVLQKLGQRWLKAFLKKRESNPKEKPPPNTYNHEEIVSTPKAMSHHYLSCSECNGVKKPNRSIPVSDCVDPCDTSVNSSEHLTFEADLIRARGGSPKGRSTIMKYILDRPELDGRRSRQLRLMVETIMTIQQKMIDEGRKSMTEQELEMLHAFAQPEWPFSLMLSVYLERHRHLLEGPRPASATT
ncbi:hypothetical protein [Chondromyces apiculatus]|uniref:Uncharacterized protein n=1 Tax=Chondromyces apiculatus DSM 436 TaxID=1192034 RepID=A0A017T212_9BACT|nr:hypothetical protein [Chondromyces apiculatus]EYF02551.1 Hypothetical protein CAP_6758 [Chondromyces apiculatus DSM 436]